MGISGPQTTPPNRIIEWEPKRNDQPPAYPGHPEYRLRRALGLVACLVLLLIFGGVTTLLAGIGLLKLEPWGRILAIIISAIDLLNVPIGTALGIYGLWVLLDSQTEALFEHRGTPAPSAPGASR